MVNKFIIFLIFFAHFSSCTSNTQELQDEVRSPSHIAGEIRTRAANKMAKKYNLIVVGMSAAMPEGIINNLGLRFHIHQAIKIEQARQILVNCVQELLTDINSNEEIRPYLEMYPFTPQNITISIIIYQKNGAEVFDPGICAARATRGKIWYSTMDKKNVYEYKSEYKESFEEAVKLVKESESKKEGA